MLQQGKNLILAIREYEDSVDMPIEERVTYTDELNRLHFIAGDDNYEQYRNYAAKCAEYLRFGDEIDEATCGAIPQFAQLKVCDTPEILLKAGFVQKPMLYTQRHLLDAIHPKSDENYHWHGVDIAKIKRLPQLLETPVLLCDSPARNDVLLAVLKCVDNDRLPMIAAIKPDGNGIYQLTATESNFILSVYGKNEFDLYFEQRITPERIVFYDKEKGRDLERLAGIQFPEYYSKLASDTIIHKPLCICNRRNKQVSYAANPSLEQRKETMRSIQEMRRPDISLQMKDETAR